MHDDPSIMAASGSTIVFLPYWASGHFMSMIEAGKRMLDSSGGALSLTVLVIKAPTPAKASEVEEHVRREEDEASDRCRRRDIRFVRLPADEPPADCAGVEEFNFRYVQLHAPRIAQAVTAGPQVAAIVVDMFCTPLLDVLAVPRYVYFASTGAFLALMLRLPALREDVFEEAEEGALDVPGLPPVPRSNVPVCLSSKNYRWFEYYARRFLDAAGIVINSSVELERGVLTAVSEGRCCVPAPAVHAIGPVIWFAAACGDQEPRHECERWLDAQPPASVVFLCFGSIGFLDKAQVAEAAAGLERSGQRFLWVLRGPPPAAGAGARYPTDGADLDALLPAGFLDRTEGRGIVWPRWAPQKKVLAHPAVGGFVTHCGWNSVLESLWNGVPMVPWPLYGEQHVNAFELVADMGVAVELKTKTKTRGSRDDGDGSVAVEAAELERAVRALMGETAEGRKARETAAEKMAACRKAVAEGGSSCTALRKLVAEIVPRDGVGRRHDMTYSLSRLGVHDS